MVDLGIQYDNYEYFEGYRQDCSGFVSMAWQLASNKTTRTLDEVAHNITKEQLLPGDALLWVNPNPAKYGHVRIFGGWVDAARTRFWTYEQTPPKAVRREYTWTASVNAGYRAIRYDRVVEDGAPRPVRCCTRSATTAVPGPVSHHSAGTARTSASRP